MRLIQRSAERLGAETGGLSHMFAAGNAVATKKVQMCSQFVINMIKWSLVCRPWLPAKRLIRRGLEVTPKPKKSRGFTAWHQKRA